MINEHDYLESPETGSLYNNGNFNRYVDQPE